MSVTDRDRETTEGRMGDSISLEVAQLSQRPRDARVTSIRKIPKWND